jgi:hypothetical protein
MPVSPLLVALIAGDVAGILARARRRVRAQADRGVRDALCWCAFVREHGTVEQLAAAEQLVDAWRVYRERLG